MPISIKSPPSPSTVNLRGVFVEWVVNQATFGATEGYRQLILTEAISVTALTLQLNCEIKQRRRTLRAPASSKGKDRASEAELGVVWQRINFLNRVGFQLATRWRVHNGRRESKAVVGIREESSFELTQLEGSLYRKDPGPSPMTGTWRAITGSSPLRTA